MVFWVQLLSQSCLCLAGSPAPDNILYLYPVVKADQPLPTCCPPEILDYSSYHRQPDMENIRLVKAGSDHVDTSHTKVRQHGKCPCDLVQHGNQLQRGSAMAATTLKRLYTCWPQLTLYSGIMVLEKLTTYCFPKHITPPYRKKLLTHMYQPLFCCVYKTGNCTYAVF